MHTESLHFLIVIHILSRYPTSLRNDAALQAQATTHIHYILTDMIRVTSYEPSRRCGLVTLWKRTVRCIESLTACFNVGIPHARQSTKRSMRGICGTKQHEHDCTLIDWLMSTITADTDSLTDVGHWLTDWHSLRRSVHCSADGNVKCRMSDQSMNESTNPMNQWTKRFS